MTMPIAVKTYKATVYVHGAFMNTPTYRIFTDRGYKEEREDPNQADIIVWTGGEDIHPVMYGENPIPGTYCNRARDIQDVAMYHQLNKGQFLAGICRGAQLLNVLNGGSMWQDIDRHSGHHHDVLDIVTGQLVNINSLHHQQMIMNDKTGVLIAYNKLSQRKAKESRHWQAQDNAEDPDTVDPEVIWYGHTRALCFQAHPEFGHADTTKYFFELMDRYYKKG